MKKILLLSIGLFCIKTATSQVTVSGPTVTYPTLGDAFTAINAGTHTGAITIDISASTTETASAVLNSSGAGSANYTSVLIFPSVDGVTINGSATAAAGRGVIELNAADNVTIDGDNPNTAGINRNLTIVNNNINTIAYTSVVRIATSGTAPYDNANTIVVKNVNLNGNATSRNASGNTSTTGSENTTFGVVVGPNGGAAVSALTSVTGAMAAASVVNSFSVTNCAINQVARGVAFIGNSTTSSNGVVINNNIIGGAGTLAGAPPYNTPANTVYTKGIYIQGTNAVTVSGNTIQNILSYVGVNMSGVELASSIGNGVVSVSNNTITGVVLNTTGTFASRGISVLAATGTYTLNDNIISNIQNYAGGSAGRPSGIFVNTTATSAVIDRNSISNIVNRNTGTWGCAALFLSGGNNITVKNNRIFDVNQDFTGGAAFSTTFGLYGLQVGSGTGHKIYHNSVNMYGALIGTATTSNLVYAFGIVNSSSTGMDVRNNIFSNTMTGGLTSVALVSIYLPSGATNAMSLTINNNAYYSSTASANNGIAQVGTTAGTGFYVGANFNSSAVTPANNLRAYTSTLNTLTTNDDKSFANTVANPFISNTNLHINNAAISPLESTGASTVITNVTVDMDNDQRPGPVASVNGGGTAPDMGADEFDGFPVPACAGAPVASSVTATNATLCAGGNITMSLSVSYTLPGIAYQWQNSPTLAGTYTNIPGATNAAYTATNQTSTSFYQAVITCTNGPASTTATPLQVVVNPLPIIVTSPSSTNVCIPGSTVVALGASGGSTYTWSPIATLSSSVGASVNASPSVTTVYTVTGTSSLGCNNVTTATVVANVGLNMDSVGVNPTAICAGNNATLTAYASAPPLTYCQATYATGTGSGDYISSVILSTLSNTSVGSASPYYTLYPQSLTTTTLVAGTTYSLNLIAGTYSDNDLASWIDYNQNGVFDAAEKLGEVDGLGASPTSTTIVFTVPLTAINGTVRLRVREMDHGGVNDMDPCAVQSSWGETEDYVITITGGVTPTMTYSWIPATFLSSTSTQSTVANAATATTAYSVTVTNAAGCSTTGAKTLTVNALPVVGITGTTAICSGNSAILTGTGATTYSWNTSASTNTISINPVTPTTYSVLGTDANNCSNTATFAVNINSSPTVSVANGTICSGSSFTLNPSGATSYTYSTGPVVTPSTNSTYTVTGANAAGCTNSTVATVSVNATPTVNATSSASLICNGSPAVLTATGASTYSWNTTATTSTISVTPSVTTSYTVTGTTNGCSNTFVISQAVSPCTGVNANAITVSGLLVYPNPNTGEFTIELNNGSVKNIDVMDLTGRVIISNSSSNDKVDFNINTLANGVYYVRIQSNNTVEVIKIVKQ